jgi:predicted phage tail protein
MRKKFLGVLCVIIGVVLLASAWVLAHTLVGGEQEADGHHVVLTPHPLSVPLPLFIFLFFGGISLIMVGVLWFIVSRQKEKEAV